VVTVSGQMSVASLAVVGLLDDGRLYEQAAPRLRGRRPRRGLRLRFGRRPKSSTEPLG
jgi:hypothetical protein